MKVLLIILPIFASMLEGIFIKHYSSKYDKGGNLFIAFISLFSMLFFVITDKNGLFFSKEILFFGIVAGILYCTASLMTYVAIACGSFGMTNLILSYGMVFSIGYGLIFLRDPAGPLTYTGLAVVLISLFLINSPDKSEKTKVSGKWLLTVFISMAASGMFGVMQKMQQARFDNAYTNEFMIVALGFSAIVLVAFSIYKTPDQLTFFLRHGLGGAVGAGLSNGAANFLSLALLNIMPISIASPTKASTKIVVSFLWAYLVYHERYSKKQLAGVLFGVVAIILLNI